jgi:ABC-2 type transport system permease protein
MTAMQQPMYYDSAVARRTVLGEIKFLYQCRDLIWQLTIRNLTVRYKRSVLGVLWTMLDPLMTMLIMTFVFDALLMRSIPNFAVYLLTALTVWNFFSQSTSSAMADFISGSHILSKVSLPQSLFVIVAITTGLVNFFISLTMVFVIAIFSGMPLSIPLCLTLVIPVAVLIIFNLGIGLILAPSIVYFNDLENIYNISLRLLLYLSAIFYMVKDLPLWLQKVININPVYHFIVMFRAPIHSNQLIPVQSLVYTGVLSVVLLVVGMVYFIRLSDDVATKIN